MQQNLALLLEDLEVGKAYHNYSGRGMYGRTTTGLIVPDFSTFITALYDYSEEIQRAKEDGFIGAENQFAHDEFGLEIIVY